MKRTSNTFRLGKVTSENSGMGIAQANAMRHRRYRSTERVIGPEPTQKGKESIKLRTHIVEDQKAAGTQGDVWPVWSALADTDTNVVLVDERSLILNARVDLALGAIGDGLSRIIAGRTTEEIAAAIVALPEKERVILALYFFEELTPEEIGAVLHLGHLTAVEVLLSAVSLLGALLEAQRA